MLAACIVDVEDGQVAELGIDVADAGDSRAVVMRAAHHDDVA